MTPPARRVHDITLNTTDLKCIKLGVHNNLRIYSLDDTVMTPPSDDTYSATAMVPLLNAGEVLTLYGDRRQEISLQALAIVGARVRIITW